jgi:hypothetical protein
VTNTGYWLTYNRGPLPPPQQVTKTELLHVCTDKINTDLYVLAVVVILKETQLTVTHTQIKNVGIEGSQTQVQLGLSYYILYKIF